MVFFLLFFLKKIYNKFVMLPKWRTSKNYLAKFGYVTNMILFYKKTGSFYNLYYLLELIIKIWWIWPIFSIKNHVHSLINIFFKSKFDKKKKKLYNLTKTFATRGDPKMRWLVAHCLDLKSPKAFKPKFKGLRLQHLINPMPPNIFNVHPHLKVNWCLS